MEGITFSSDLKGKMNMEDHIEGAEMMNDYFKTQEHSEEMQVNMNNINWVHNNILDFYNVIKFKGKIIGSTFMMPCTKLIIDKFLSKKINESELFDEIKNNVNIKNFDALYLCSSFIKPEFRGKGLSVEARMKTIRKVTKGMKKKPVLFCDAYTKEGEKSCKETAKRLGLVLKFR